MISSRPKRFTDFVDGIEISPQDPDRDAKNGAKANARQIALQIDGIRAAGGMQDPNIVNLLNQLAAATAVLASGTETNPPSVINYGPVNAEGAGTEMRASILSTNRPQGSRPSDNPPIWQMVNRRRYKDSAYGPYVQGHLLNERLGGPGRAYKLTPISRQMNSSHERLVEADIKAAVDAANGGSVVSYTVIPTYVHHPTRSFQQILNNKADRTPAEQRKLDLMNYEQQKMPRAFQIEWATLRHSGSGWVTDQQRPAMSISNELPDDDFDIQS
jgi:hypothetical protein